MKLQTEGIDIALVEDGIPAHLQTMTPEKVFWSHLGINLAPAGWVLGAIIGGMGLDLRTAIVAVVLGNVLGSIPVGLCAMLGPPSRLTQIENSRFSFGRTGTRLPAILNWLGAVGWDAVNNVPSVLAIVALFALLHVAVPFWAALLLLSLVQLTASMCGHHVVQLLGKYLGYVLVVIFAITGAIAVASGGSLTSAHGAFSAQTFVLVVSLTAGFAIGFAPYSSDYTRYLPARTPSRRIFTLAFVGVGSSALVLEIIGLLTARKLADLTPGGVIGGIAHLCGSFAPLALLAIAASAIVINSLNDNTAAYSLISAGIRLPRHIAAFITAACGFALAVAGAGAFAQLFSNYMLVLLYWIAPWAAIVLANWYLLRDRTTVPPGWAPGATVFAVVTALTIGLFSATDVYTGPVARALGGTDIGYFVGFFAAGGLYLLVARFAIARRTAADTPRSAPQREGLIG